jgi:sodium/hydrogen exchanger 8
LFSDIFGMSPIVTLFFSGIIMAHYHYYNISNEAQVTLTLFLHTSAFLAENFIFVYLGVSVFAYPATFHWDWKLISWTLCACLLARAFNTFPLSALANTRRKKPIPREHQFVIWFAGLRGAIAFALSLTVDTEFAKTIKGTTLAVIIFTTLILGAATAPLLKLFSLVEQDEGPHPTSEVEMGGWDPATEEGDDGSDGLLESAYEPPQMGAQASDQGPSYSPVSQPAGKKQYSGIHGLWHNVDKNYLKPFLGGRQAGQPEAPKFEAPRRRSARMMTEPAQETAAVTTNEDDWDPRA